MTAEGGMVRSFVAVETTAAVRSELAGLLDRLRHSVAARVRWVKPDLMHLTLAFLGEVPTEFIDKARGRLAEVAAASAPVSCRLSSCGAFPNPLRARVAWVGMSEGGEELKRLQRAVSDALARVGYEPERRPFSPHLTLGRLREPADISAITGVQFQSSPFAVDHIVLFRSDLRPEGPLYTKLAEFRLG